MRAGLAPLLVAVAVLACGGEGPSPPPPEDGARLVPDPTSEFCGTSSTASCRSDADCATGGCSGQLCLGAREAAGVVTTCEWRDCYDEARFGLGCGCVAGRCAWH